MADEKNKQLALKRARAEHNGMIQCINDEKALKRARAEHERVIQCSTSTTTPPDANANANIYLDNMKTGPNLDNIKTFPTSHKRHSTEPEWTSNWWTNNEEYPKQTSSASKSMPAERKRLSSWKSGASSSSA